MEALQFLIDFILHVDRHLIELTREYGPWVYGILALVIFVETGLVFMPLLPGDSLLFAAGALAAQGSLDVHLLAALLSAAAIAGDSLNYAIGRHFGHRMTERGSRWLRPEYLARTHAFFDRHGGAAIVLARFVPIVRTFAPFVAGIGRMDYRTFLAYNIAGGISWVLLFSYAGYFFGALPIVKENLQLVMLGIVLISVTPVLRELLRHLWARRRRAGP